MVPNEENEIDLDLRIENDNSESDNSNDEENEIVEVKEKLVMFGLEEAQCDVAISSKDKIVYVKSTFMRYVLGDRFNEIVVLALDDNVVAEGVSGNENFDQNVDVDNFEGVKQTKYKVNLEMENVDSSSIEYALSYYQPLQFTGELDGKYCDLVSCMTSERTQRLSFDSNIPEDRGGRLSLPSISQITLDLFLQLLSIKYRAIIFHALGKDSLGIGPMTLFKTTTVNALPLLFMLLPLAR